MLLGSGNLQTVRINNKHSNCKKKGKCLGFLFSPSKFWSDISRFNVPKVNPLSNFCIKKFEPTGEFRINEFEKSLNTKVYAAVLYRF